MLYFSRWKVIAILTVVLAGVVFAAPNVMPKPWQDTLQRHAGLAPMVRDIDLQGGTNFLVELDSKEMLDTLIVRQVADVRQVLRDARIAYKALGRTPDGVTVEIVDAAHADKAYELLNQTIQPIDASLFELTRSDQQFRFTFSEKAVAARSSQTVEQSIAVLQRRLNGLGIREISVQRQGIDRILIQVPGTSDTESVKKMIGLTDLLSFQATCEHPATATSSDCAAYALKASTGVDTVMSMITTEPGADAAAKQQQGL